MTVQLSIAPCPSTRQSGTSWFCPKPEYPLSFFVNSFWLSHCFRIAFVGQMNNLGISYLIIEYTLHTKPLPKVYLVTSWWGVFDVL